MNSKETFEIILKRNKYVMSCDCTRNSRYAEYLNASSSYDKLKKGFYIALELSRHDKDVREERNEISNKKNIYVINKTFRIRKIRAFGKKHFD